MKTKQKRSESKPMLLLTLDNSSLGQPPETLALTVDLLRAVTVLNDDLEGGFCLPIEMNFCRAEVARAVREVGFVAYVGGRHVSVNTASGQRLGIITGNFDEWL